MSFIFQQMIILKLMIRRTTMKPLLDINFWKWAAELEACWGPPVRPVKLSHRVLPVTKGAPVLVF